VLALGLLLGGGGGMLLQLEVFQEGLDARLVVRGLSDWIGRGLPAFCGADWGEGA
jgi:hypothetical protein